MARAKQHSLQIDFSKGKITEVTNLGFPEGAVRVCENFELRIDKSVRRRLGIDYESGYSLHNVGSISNKAISYYEWKSVDNQAAQDFGVIQVGSVLWMFDLTESVVSDGYLGTVNLSSYKVNAGDNYEYSFSSGRGALFVVGSNIDPVRITYVDAAFSVERILIQIRDFEGLDDGLDPDERPSADIPTHRYNLQNQGWPTSFECSTEARAPSVPNPERVSVQNPINLTKTKLGVYPSNADIIHIARRTFSNGTNPYEPFKLQEFNLGNTRAPRGRYILDAFSKDYSGVSGITGLVPVVTTSRPSTTAFFAGRAFYGGSEGTEEATAVYFSQVLESLERAGFCYQDQDPTAEVTNSVLDTDGGVIRIPDAGNIIRLTPYKQGILVFAKNGIWYISGSSDLGFTPTTFTVNFITSAGALGSKSIIETDDGYLYWSAQGIYALSFTDGVQVRNVSLTTIQSDYLAIPSASKASAVGVYDRNQQRVLWMYQQDSEITGTYNCNKILWLDMTLTAFYDYVISESSTSPFMVGALPKSALSRESVSETVTDSGGFPVTDSTPADVTLSMSSSGSNTLGLKYITFVANGADHDLTFSEFWNDEFLDWYTSDNTGLDAPAEIEPGWYTLSDVSRDKQIQFLVIHFQRTEQNWIAVGDDYTFDNPSSALCRVKFDFTGTATGNRWTSEFQGYRLKNFTAPSGVGVFDYSHDVVSFKQRVRGHGRGCAVNVRTEAGKDLRFLGYDIEFTGRTRV
jgi:hypothetical protein